MNTTPRPNSNATITEILKQAASLTVQERKDLVKKLVDSLEVTITAVPHRRQLSELQGLGKEIWRKMDAQQYVAQLRDEWDS